MSVITGWDKNKPKKQAQCMARSEYSIGKTYTRMGKNKQKSQTNKEICRFIMTM